MSASSSSPDGAAVLSARRHSKRLRFSDAADASFVVSQPQFDLSFNSTNQHDEPRRPSLMERSASENAQRSRSPPPIRRSLSFAEVSYTSPVRSDCSPFRHELSKRGLKLQRSKSFQGLSFDQRLGYEDGAGPRLENSSLGSSGGSDPDLSRFDEDNCAPLGAAESDANPNLQRWLRETTAMSETQVMSAFGGSSTASNEQDVITKMSSVTIGQQSAAAAAAAGGSHIVVESNSLCMPPPPLLTGCARFLQQQNSQIPFQTPSREQSIQRQCDEIDVCQVVGMCKRKIKLAIFDFDHTVLDIHTKGHWTGSATTLADRHVRPIFRVLIPALLEAGIPVGIATFSTQEELISEVVRHLFRDARLEENFFIRGTRWGDRHASSQECESDLMFADAADSGKRAHIQCILDRLPDDAGASIAPFEILFVDDDAVNASAAANDGHRAVIFHSAWTDDMVLCKLMDALTK